MTDLVAGKIGTVGSYDLAFTAGKVVVTAGVALPEATVSLSVAVSPKEILDVIAARIGGPIPLEVAKFLESALALA